MYFFPLFMTGYVIADLLLDSDWCGAQQAVIGSASSKTGFSAAAFIRAAGFEGTLIGLTGEQNAASLRVGLLRPCGPYGQLEALATSHRFISTSPVTWMCVPLASLPRG